MRETDWSDVASGTAIQCLRLHLVSGVGPLRFRSLMDHFGNVSAVMVASRDELEQVNRIGPRTSDAICQKHSDAFVLEELARARRLKARILCQADHDYPALLKEIPDAPVCLYVLGEIQGDDRSMLAVVGARRCSTYGREQAYQFGMSLSRLGVTVVSGLARGIDAEAHRGAVDCQGKTIAVLGSGLECLTEHANCALAQRILEQGGAIVSELPIDRQPDAQNYPARNRLIAGMTLGTLVIEASRRSGALITANLALEYNREVFALPGRIDYETSYGGNVMIQRQHAKLVTGIRDILEELGHALGDIREGFQQTSQKLWDEHGPTLSDDERNIYGVLDAEGKDLEYICRSVRLPPERISNALTLLQLKSLIEQLPGSRFARLSLPSSTDM